MSWINGNLLQTISEWISLVTASTSTNGLSIKYMNLSRIGNSLRQMDNRCPGVKPSFDEPIGSSNHAR